MVRSLLLLTIATACSETGQRGHISSWAKQILVGLLIAFCSVGYSGDARASNFDDSDWSLEYRTSFLSSRHRVLTDTGTPGNQGFWGVGILANRRHVGPIGIGVSGFVGRSHGDLPSFVQLEFGMLVSFDVGREDGFGVGVVVHPVWSWWLSQDRKYTDPGLDSVIEDLPQMALLLGSKRTWFEFGAGGAANALDPRVGHLTFNWGNETDRFEAGLAVITAPFVGWGTTDTELVYLGGTGGWWHRFSSELGVGLGLDIGFPFVIGVRVGLTQSLCL